MLHSGKEAGGWSSCLPYTETCDQMLKMSQRGHGVSPLSPTLPSRLSSMRVTWT